MSQRNRSKMSRRTLLGSLGIGVPSIFFLSSRTAGRERPQRIVNNRISQSVAYWCFKEHWDIEKMCQIAKQLGIKSIELLGIEGQDKLKGYWDTLKTYDLVDGMHFCHGFEKGMNNPENWDMCLKALRDGIDACAAYGFPNVLTFTGFRVPYVPDDYGIKICVNGYKKIIGYAEKKKVNICLEILNSRVNVEMKGHPGYQGDHTDYCMEIIRQVGSPRMKLLFDIYHVQIMDGDIIARIRQYKDYIGHYHVAGNPGRREPDNEQEINYRPIMEEIVRTGYTGYVGQEFIPTGDNPFESLTKAVILCDV